MPDPKPDKARYEKFFGPAPESRIRTIYDKLAEVIEPKSDLDFKDPFQLLVAVVLSAQATDKSVNEALIKLYPVAGTPEAIYALGVEGLKPYIKTIGLYNAKAKNVIKLCKILIEKHQSQIPEDRAALEALPGVGRKTANVVLNISFGWPTLAVDTHVQRVANRLDIARTTKVEDTENVLLLRTPRKHLLHAHHYLILHGRYCCTARNPACERCPITRQCASIDKHV